MTAAQNSPLRAFVDRFVTWWSLACALGIVASVGTRSLYFAVPHLPRQVEAVVGHALSRSASGLIGFFTRLPFLMLPVFVFAVLLLVRRSWCVARNGQRVGLRAAWLCLFWALLYLADFAFDFSRYVSSVAWLTVPLAATLMRLNATAAWSRRVGGALAWSATAVIAAALASNGLDAIGVLVWGGWVLALYLRGPHVLPGRDRALFLALGIPTAQVVVASSILLSLTLAVAWIVFCVIAARRKRLSRWRLVLVCALASCLGLGAVHVVSDETDLLVFHDGTLLADGLAYSYCEMPERGRVFATVPVCSQGSDACAEAGVMEYALDEGFRVVRHRLFEPGGFWGRIEQIACIGDSVQIGLCCTKGGGSDDEATVTWSPDAPNRYVRHPPETTGRRVVLDRKRGSTFYLGEHVWHLDGVTGRSSNDLEERLIAASDYPGRTPGNAKRMFLAEAGSVDSVRDRIFIAEFNAGSNIYEVDLGSLRIVRTFRPQGGVTAVTVDRTAQRIWTVGMFGLEVFDVPTGQRVTRRRTGALPRSPVIDHAHDLVYIPTTIGGRIEVFDRQSATRLGDIAIGLETRYAFLTGDAKWFFATASKRHYYWNAVRLAERFSRRSR